MRLLLGLWMLFGGGPPEVAPAPLRCLERFYAARAEKEAGRWQLRLPDGRPIPYDDGRTKTAEERLADPDVKDVFSPRYPQGPIRPVRDPDADPGRNRIEPLFAATYGRRRAEIDLVPFRLAGRTLEVHRKVLPAFVRVAARLERAQAADPSLRRFLEQPGGTFAWREIAGTDRRSAHAYGIAIDLNVALSAYWRWQRPREPLRWRNRMPQAIVDAFEAEGFIWGGRWYHYDTMHFEYRPELLDPGCYP